MQNENDIKPRKSSSLPNLHFGIIVHVAEVLQVSSSIGLDRVARMGKQINDLGHGRALLSLGIYVSHALTLAHRVI
jgi:hypothetical protein